MTGGSNLTTTQELGPRPFVDPMEEFRKLSKADRRKELEKYRKREKITMTRAIEILRGMQDISG